MLVYSLFVSLTILVGVLGASADMMLTVLVEGPVPTEFVAKILNL
jgi:hypothetical protein